MARAPELGFAALERALADATETIAVQLGRPGGPMPDWSATEWAIARAVAAIHGVSPLLAQELRWRGPPEWSRFLTEQRTHTLRRWERMQGLLLALDERARAANIAIVPLKGAALHVAGVYAAGERPMADLDLLVHERDVGATTLILTGLGFRHTLTSWKHRVFESSCSEAPAALGEHGGNALKVEVHRHVAECLPRAQLDLSAVVFPGEPQAGLNAYPSRAALFAHLLLHAAGSLVLGSVRLVQLVDLARLSCLMDAADWEALFACTGDTLWWAYPPLALTARYFPHVPPAVLAHAARRCSWLLRHSYRRRDLTRASLSHLWITAFPGIEWARSPNEFVRFAFERLVPTAATRRERREAAQLQPQVSGGAWAARSQLQRMLYFMIARQPRQATLEPVRAALGGAAHTADQAARTAPASVS
jgi:hypothetical protein